MVTIWLVNPVNSVIICSYIHLSMFMISENKKFDYLNSRFTWFFIYHKQHQITMVQRQYNTLHSTCTTDVWK